jgi:hypothetical protein
MRPAGRIFFAALPEANTPYQQAKREAQQRASCGTGRHRVFFQPTVTDFIGRA